MHDIHVFVSSLKFLCARYEQILFHTVSQHHLSFIIYGNCAFVNAAAFFIFQKENPKNKLFMKNGKRLAIVCFHPL